MKLSRVLKERLQCLHRKIGFLEYDVLLFLLAFLGLRGLGVMMKEKNLDSSDEVIRI